MNRTYNFQVDNGLFATEYLLNKNYTDINIDDLKSNISMLSDRVYEVNELKVLNSQGKPTRLSTLSHNNSALSQPAYLKNRREKIELQLKMLLDNIGDDKICIICGQKRVNTKQVIRSDTNNKYGYIPSSSLMAGLPSHDNFMNRANNLQTIDVCPICLFFSVMSVLNTQKISYPFLYMSDSDEFMRDITKEAQHRVAINEILDIKQSSMSVHFVETMSNIMKNELIYDDINYIELVYFHNGKSNYYEEQVVDKMRILFLLKLKNRGLINEFYKLNLFNPLIEDKNLIPYLINTRDYELKCSNEMLVNIQEEFVDKDDIKIIEFMTSKLLERSSIEDLLKELKLCRKKREFKEFIIGYSEIETIYRSLNDFMKITEKHYVYYDLLIANLLLINNREEEQDVK